MKIINKTITAPSNDDYLREKFRNFKASTLTVAEHRPCKDLHGDWRGVEYDEAKNTTAEVWVALNTMGGGLEMYYVKRPETYKKMLTKYPN